MAVHQNSLSAELEIRNTTASCFCSGKYHTQCNWARKIDIQILSLHVAAVRNCRVRRVLWKPESALAASFDRVRHRFDDPFEAPPSARSEQTAFGRIFSYFGDAPAMLRLISMASETLSSNWPGLMLKSLRLMLKLERMTSRSPFWFGTRSLSLSFR